MIIRKLNNSFKYKKWIQNMIMLGSSVPNYPWCNINDILYWMFSQFSPTFVNMLNPNLSRSEELSLYILSTKFICKDKIINNIK